MSRWRNEEERLFSPMRLFGDFVIFKRGLEENARVGAAARQPQARVEGSMNQLRDGIKRLVLKISHVRVVPNSGFYHTNIPIHHDKSWSLPFNETADPYPPGSLCLGLCLAPFTWSGYGFLPQTIKAGI